MVSEITRFYCKADMTSSWFLRYGALHEIFHDGFWKSDRGFLIAFHSNFLSGMHSFRDNEVLLQDGYDVIVIYLKKRFEKVELYSNMGRISRVERRMCNIRWSLKFPNFSKMTLTNTPQWPAHASTIHARRPMTLSERAAPSGEIWRIWTHQICL